MTDPYDWSPPDLPPEQMTDADWLRSHARANFITEDIERADRIARSVEVIAETLAALRADLDATARSVAVDVTAERDHLLVKVAKIRAAVMDWQDVGTALDAIDKVEDVLNGLR